MSEDFENGGPRIVRGAAYVLGGMGLSLTVAAGVWWLYVTITEGVTPSELAEIGMSMVFVAFGILVASAAWADPEFSLFGKEDENDFQ